jgi:hypothetical protein
MKMHNPAISNTITLPTFPAIDNQFAPASYDAGGKAWGAFVTPAMLKAFLVNASSDGVRVNLNQVRIEHHEDRTFFVATDGHRLAWLDLVVPSSDREERERALAPLKGESEGEGEGEGEAKGKGKGKGAVVVYHVKREDLERAVKLGDAGVAFGLDGKIVPLSKIKGEKATVRVESPVAYVQPRDTFPPWLQVVPAGYKPGWVGVPAMPKADRCVQGFNGTYLTQAVALGMSMGDGKNTPVRIVPGESELSPALVIGDGLAGFAVTILMPMRV